MCGTACVKHSTFWFTIVSFLLAVYSPPDRPLEKKELGLASVSPSVSVALVSTLATVSVHFCLCRLGLHTCHSVSPLLSLSPWSPHLPQYQSTASSSVSVTVHAVIPTAPLDESIVNGYRRYSQNSRSYLLPGTLTGVEPESSGEHLSPVTTKTSSQASLSELNVTVHVLFFASVRPTGQLERRGAEVTWRVSDWSTSVGCWDCLHVLDPDRLSAARWVAVLFVCSLCAALAVFVSRTRGVYPNWRRNDAAAVCDSGALLPDWMDRDDGAEEISR